MGTVNVVIGPVTTVAHGGRVFQMQFRSAENVTTSGVSAATTGTAEAGDVARIKAITGACYVGEPDEPAISGAGWYLDQGDVLDLGGLREGDTVNIIEA